jgi:hypothetical protein
VTSDNEQDITNGIIKVVSGQQKKVYFTQGHGERDTSSRIAKATRRSPPRSARENYSVDKLVLAQQGAVPDDAALVIVAGPRTDFFPPEIDALKKYHRQVGQAAAGDRPAGQTRQCAAHESDCAGARLGHGRRQRRRRRRERHGPAHRNGRVGAGRGELPAPSDHAAIHLPDGVSARAVGHSGPWRRERATPRRRSSSRDPRSWAETDIKSLLTSGKVALDEDKGDKKGPIAIASAVSASSTAAPKPGEPADAPET